MNRYLLCILFLGISYGSCASPKENSDSDLEDRKYLFEVAQYLYRSYLDENHAQIIEEEGEVVFWVREESEPMDSDDESRFGTILLPQLNYSCSVKKADYSIPELGLEVRNESFKIINVSAFAQETEPDGFTSVTISADDIQEMAHRTRAEARFPEGELLMEMRKAARLEILQYVQERNEAGLPIHLGEIEHPDHLATKQQIAYMAPLSNVANDVWIYWETGEMLLHFSSDLDLEDPGLWGHEHLKVDLYDLEVQTVVSLQQVAGSNAYLTRDQVGRALFNCIVLGKKVVLAD